MSTMQSVLSRQKS